MDDDRDTQLLAGSESRESRQNLTESSLRIVVVCYSYYPAQTPRAFRWGSVCAGLAARGHAVDVVCGAIVGSPVTETHQGVRIHRVGGVASDFLRSRVQTASSTGGSPGAGSSFAANRLRRAAVRLARIVHDLTWKKIYWPDSNCLWSFPATRKAGELLDTAADAVLVTVSLPFTDHVAGLRLKSGRKRLGWLVDVGDPFSLGHHAPTANPVFYRRANIVAERRVFEEADAITVTTEGARKAYAKSMGSLVKKMDVIPPLLSLMPKRATGPGRPAAPREISLLFVGTLYRTLRSPEFLLRLFERIVAQHPGADFHLGFIGVDGGCSSLVEQLAPRAASRISFGDPQPRESVYRALERATVLVNIGNDTPYQLPSKLVEYVATGKPILNIVRTMDDSSVDFLRPHPRVKNVVEGAGNLDDIARDAGEWLLESGGAAPAVNEEWVNGFLPEAIVARYEKVLARVSQRPAAGV